MESIRSKFKKYIGFIDNYRIHVNPGEQFRGIKDTLFGWALVGLILTIKIEIDKPLLVLFSFFISYLSAALFLFLQVALDSLLRGNFFRGLRVFLISNYTDEDTKEAHLSVRQRIFFIYLRGIFATSGWIGLNVASLYFDYIDNSALFAADALVFTILSVWWLGRKLSLRGWGYVLIAFFGVAFVLFFDYTNINRVTGFICFAAAIYSAVAFSIIFFMTTIIIRHDSPTRVAFHQVLTGAVISLLGYLIFLVNSCFHSEAIPEITPAILNNSIICGVLYAIAIPRFLRAFLFADPVVIAVLGYTLPLFVLFFGFFKGIVIKGKDIVSNLLVACGCYGLIREESKKEGKLTHEKQPAQVPLYEEEVYAQIKQKINIEKSLRHEFSSMKQCYLSGQLDRYEYISKKHEFNKILLEYSTDINNTDISFITIEKNAVIFNINPLNIELETDGAARSAPFEILNFGYYEPEDEQMIYQLIKGIKNAVIFDIGANIGWHTINFAKRFPEAKIFSFEPIQRTYEYLEKNIERNSITNCVLMNCGVSNENREAFLYYFKSGSAIASINNLIEHPNAKKEKCLFKTLNKLFSDLELERIDFIKCDVEGSELFVLQGAEKVIEEVSPIFLIEICEEWCQKCKYRSKDIILFLKNLGYEFFSTSDGKILERRKDIRPIDQGKYNYFFLHKKKHQDLINQFCSLG